MSIVEAAAKEPTIVEDEINRIANWLQPQVSTTRLWRLLYRLIRGSLPKDAGAGALFHHPAWNRYYNLWRDETAKRFKALLPSWPGAHHQAPN